LAEVVLGQGRIFRYAYVAGKLTKPDAGSEGGLDLLPPFSGNLTAHVRLNLIFARAIELAEWNPQEPDFFVELAYATRRAELIHAAHDSDAGDGPASNRRDDPVQCCLQQSADGQSRPGEKRCHL